MYCNSSTILKIFVIRNIKWLCYNAFYQTPLTKNLIYGKILHMISEIKNINLHGYPYSENATRKHKKLEFETLWQTVDPVKFYKKDQPNNTFKSQYRKFR